MPSACTKPESKASFEAPNAVVQCMTIVEKKLRNLEKRKIKLDQYKERRDSGQELNEDQQEAITKYEGVVQNLEFAKEMQKQFQGIGTEIEKMTKKQLKRQKAERQDHEISRIRELLKLQDLLSNMGSEEVRDDFKNGNNGAVSLSEEDLTQLDELYKLITPSRDGEVGFTQQLAQSSDHVANFLDGREKEVVGTSYKQLRELVEKIEDSGYFDKMGETPAKDTAASEEVQQAEEDVDALEDSSSSSEQQVLDPVETSIGAAVSDVSVDSPPVALEPEPLPVIPAATMGLTHEHPAEYVDESSSFFTSSPQQTQQYTVTAEVAPPAESTQYSQQKPRREIQEIVSSVQGSFNFLQDSEIDSEYAAGLQQAGFLDNQTANQSPATYSQQASHHNVAQQPTHHGTAPQGHHSAVSQGHHSAASQGHHSAAPGHHAAATSVTQTQHTEALDFGASSIVESLQQSSTASQLQFGAVDSMVPSSERGASVSISAVSQQSNSNLDTATLR